MTRRRRVLTAEERRLWAAFARATVPLEGRVLPPEEPAPRPVSAQEPVAPAAAPPSLVIAPAIKFMAVSIVAFVVLGSVLEGIPAIVLFGPLLFPIAKLVGIHEVHYAMVVILAMGIGLFAPPFGVGYYAACAIGRVDPSEGLRPILPYILALIVGTIIVAAIPWISTGFLGN
jgi:hypothetical protein